MKLHHLILIGSCLITTSSLAKSVEEIDKLADPTIKGRAIAEEADKRENGYGDSEATMHMVLKNAKGQESVRQLRIKSWEDPNATGQDRGLIVFDEPRDVAGTALLTHAHPAEDDKQWLYLPASAKVKRISGSNQTGSFMGSEFSFEDFSSNSLEKYTYAWLRDELCDEDQCWVIERVPTNPNSGYTRQLAWVDKAEFRLRRVDFFDKREKLLKTLIADDYKLHLERFWRAHTLTMENHLTRKSTILTWKEIAFQVGLQEQDFTQGALKRAR
ncbi:MAG: outer membrane lipoprotein-sorting protein [Alphaproteobacteria bacterium]